MITPFSYAATPAGYECSTDQLGGLVPAVPTEDGTTFRGYTSVSDAGCRWWRALPSVGVAA